VRKLAQDAGFCALPIRLSANIVWATQETQMIFTFDANHVLQLLDLSSACDARRPLFEDMCNPEMWRADMVEDRRAQLMAELGESGYPASAKPEDVDPAKLPVGLHLVGDQGIYLMSQESSDAVKKTGISHVAYAKECNPEVMAFDDWWEAKRAGFGGDDGVDFLSEDAILQCAPPGGILAIDLTPESMSLLIPREPAQ